MTHTIPAKTQTYGFWCARCQAPMGSDRNVPAHCQECRKTLAGLDEKIALLDARKAVQVYLAAIQNHAAAIYAIHGPDSWPAGRCLAAAIDFLSATETGMD